ncbi:MAG: NAD-dependent epimerase/dehydratase family protein [Caldilineaceae bacterium]|nr:NAD-dependent epimerase/dehydratase family protein [Caldilineaceae bacterium]
MDTVSYSNAVILGTGQVGMALMEQLVERRVKVTLVNRRGRVGEPLPEGVQLAAADVNDAAAVTRIAQDATVVFATVQPDYTQWPEKFPPLVRSLIDGIAKTDARLVFVDNLYMYGPTHGQPLREDLPYAATGPKGRTRAQVASLLLEAHRAGRIRVAIGRASDFFGPRVTATAVFGERFFGAIWKGNPVDLFGNPDLPHTYTYVPDFARALITLSKHEAAYGRAWHVPNAGTVSTREMVRLFEEALRQPIKCRTINRFMVALAALFVPMVRELKELAYEFEEPYIVDDTAFRAAFGADTTPLASAVAETAEWFRERTQQIQKAA